MKAFGVPMLVTGGADVDLILTLTPNPATSSYHC